MASFFIFHQIRRCDFNTYNVISRSIKTRSHCAWWSQWKDPRTSGPHQRYIFVKLRQSSNENPANTFLSKKKVPNESASLCTVSSKFSSIWQPPTSGLLSKLPVSWLPYAELIRLDKPAGTYYLFFPCLFSTLIAAPMEAPCSSPLSVLGTSFLFLVGAFIMRGAGCTINDLWDRDLDTKVARTRLRPIARGAITPFRALAYAGAQLMTGLGILLQFPHQCLFYGVPSLLLVAFYPLAKRLTNYPQIVLGLTFSWGAIMGFPALGVDLWHNSSACGTAILLYLSNVAWTVLYDIIYAHMDVIDDVKAGIKSIALRHNQYTKQILSGLAITQVGLLAAAGLISGSGPLFLIGSCGGAALTLAIMIKKVDLKNVRNCWWWFVNGCWITGGVISSGMATDYLIRFLYTEQNTSKIEQRNSE